MSWVPRASAALDEKVDGVADVFTVVLGVSGGAGGEGDGVTRSMTSRTKPLVPTPSVSGRSSTLMPCSMLPSTPEPVIRVGYADPYHRKADGLSRWDRWC
ncbi:MAG TPA: hypothetical protein VFG15_12590 [Amycolatopsis sp.]|nr:hypothetical protein [Amycolatopsis sp.]